MRTFLNRLLHLLRRSRHDADLREEMETHRSLRQEKLQREGVAPSEAKSASRRALGNATLAREDARGVWLMPALEGLWQDLRGALRSSRRDAASSLTIVVTLVFGLGLASAIFAFGDGYLARPLPFPDEDRLFVVRTPGTKLGMPSTVEIDALRRSALSELGFAGGGESLLGFGLQLQVDDRQIQAIANDVTEELSRVLQVPLAMGRAFVPEDYRGAEPIPVWLSHRFWQRELGGDRSILQRRLTARSGNRAIDVVVVGVTDPRITTFDSNFGRNNVLPDLFAPARPSQPQPNTFGAPIVRLPASMTSAQAEAAIAATLQAGASAPEGPRVVELIPLRDTWTSRGRPVATLLVAGALLALALVTVNLGHLLLARAAARRAEIATRSALGASRLRIARLLMFESAIYGITGIAGGLYVGRWLARTIASGVPTRGDEAGNLALVAMTFDARVVVFAAVMGVTIAIVGAAWPVWRAVSTVEPAMRMRGTAGARISTRFSRTILICEIAVSSVVLMGATFIGLGIWRYVNQPIGFDVEDRFTLSFPLQPGADEGAVDWQAVLDAVRNTPGVRHATVDRPRQVRGALQVDGVDLSSRDLTAVSVSPLWLETRGAELVSGRLMGPEEVDANVAVAVADAKFARAVWPDAAAIGQVVRIEGGPARTIVGVINHQRFSLSRESPGVVYVPQPESSRRETLNVWAPGMTTTELFGRLQGQVQQLAPGFSPVLREDTFDRVFSNDLTNVKFQRPVVIALGVFAVTLAGVGLFGLVAYLVEQRTRDFGIRIALGANRLDMLGMVLRESALPGLVGLAIGLTVWWMLEGFVRATISGWESSGPMAMAAVSATVLAAVVLAAAGPARRVLRIDPAVVLKAE